MKATQFKAAATRITSCHSFCSALPVGWNHENGDPSDEGFCLVHVCNKFSCTNAKLQAEFDVCTFSVRVIFCHDAVEPVDESGAVETFVGGDRVGKGWHVGVLYRWV